MPAINLNRRTAITALAATGVLTTMAACAAPSSTGTATPETSGSGSPETAAPSKPAATSGTFVVGKVSDVAVGGGTKFEVEGITVLITQPKAADFRAFSAVCTHAGCLVSGVSDGEIACGCHGARYDAETGAVLRGPAPTALGKIQLSVSGEDLVISF